MSRFTANTGLCSVSVGIFRSPASIRALAGVGIFTFVLLAGPCFAQSLTISGPQTAYPGEPMVFRLLSGVQTQAAEKWEQGLNPDKYTGFDYVSSFRLAFTANPDGSETIVAPSPGRYKVLAYSGGQAYQAYVLVQPVTPMPSIRGAVFSLSSTNIDRQYALSVLVAGRRAGMTWANIAPIGCMDIDSGDLRVQIFPEGSPCYFGAPMSEIEWVVDQAHLLGYKVALVPSVLARYQGSTGELQSFLLPNFPPPPPFPPIMDVFDAFSQWTVSIAAIAQAHDVEAMMIGNQWQGSSVPVDLQLNIQWVTVLEQLRSKFSGKLWVGWEFPCGPAFEFTHWDKVDGIHLAAGIKGSQPSCGGGTPSSFPTAEEMLPYFQNTESLYPFQLQASTGLPLIWADFFSVNRDGVNYLMVPPSTAAVDNQEIVDRFEAAMRAKSALPGQMDGMFFEAASLFTGSDGDIMSQPPLFAAVANWFGGDVSYVTPCFSSPAANVLYQNDFEPNDCPLAAGGTTGAPFGPLTVSPSGSDSIIEDPEDLSNHILRLSDAGANAGHTSSMSWTDYTAAFKFRIANRNAVPSVPFRVIYSIQINVDGILLFKYSAPVATYTIPSGLPLNAWNSLSLTVAGPSITIVLNGVTAIQYEDSVNPYLTGGITLTSCCSSSTGPFDFDDVIVTRPVVPLPVCTFINSLISQSVPAAGGVGTVHVSTNDPRCDWSATTGQSWITLTSGSQAVGSVPVLFTVAPNAGGVPRSGTVTIAGEPFTVSQASVPSLIVTKSHSGDFMQGQSGATYMVTVRNGEGADPTSGTVTVTETAPSGLTLMSMAGTGWTCPSGGTTCTRDDSLDGGSSYPTIIVTVNVTTDAPSRVTNQVSASGGGSTTSSVEDLTTISACSYSLDPTGISASSTKGTGGFLTNSVLGSAAAGSADVMITASPAGCSAGSWTASTANGWLGVSPASGTAAGTVTVSWQANTGAARTGTATIAGSTFTVNQAAASGVQGVFPNSGVMTGLAPVTIRGRGFLPGATVTIGGVAATIVVVVDSQTITAVTPANLQGVVDVVVTNPGGSPMTMARGFVYVPAATPTAFYTLNPCRVIDTRNASGSQGGPPLKGGGIQRVFPVAGSCQVPSDAKAVSLNVTVSDATGIGFLRIYPGDGIPSDATAIEFRPAKNRANNAMVFLATDGSGTFGVRNEAPAGTTVNIIVDVNGYYK